MQTNISGESRLGGLSLNPFNSRQFIEDIIAELAPPGLTLEAEVVVDAILDPAKGYIPIKQIKQILLSKRLTPFAQDAPQLDSENFGNAITPNFADFAYTDFADRERSSKYLTSNSLHVYTRVPTKVAGVEFSLSNGITVPGKEITLAEFQADTIPYTFRLEETLAAANLPAWPGLDNAQLFSDVRIRYSTKGPMPEEGYFSDRMNPRDTGNGVVWEKPLGIPASGTVYYYFEVVLAEPLLFTALDREAIFDLDPTTVTLDAIFAPENLHKIRIDSWAMPDPRNLQLTDRGIVKKLFTPDLATEFSNILTSPQVLDIAARVLARQQVNINEILSIATPKQLRRIQNILLRNTNALTTQFQSERDPLLASYFTVPRVDLETQSLWVAHIPYIADGNHQLKADVINDEGTVIDRIQENITVDTSAPEAGIGISPSDANAIGYLNNDEVFVATARTPGTAATLNIMGMPRAADVGPGVGYLFYQVIGLNEDGTLYQGEPFLERPNTWMPLTVESTMLVSNIWAAVQRAVAEGRLDAPSDPILQAALALPLDAILGTDETPGLLTAGMIKQFADPFLKGLEPFIGFSELNINQYQLIIDALGATVNIIDHLVPVTFSPSDHVVMPIQGAQMPLMVGDYGIRAMGIDTLFNVSSHTAPTHLKIVDSSDPAHQDRASVTFVVVGDCNLDGDMDDLFESGPVGDVTIFNNTTEDVVLTVTVDHRSPHPATVMVQYMDAAGVWKNIDTIELAEGESEIPPISWNVSDFEALLGGNEMGKVMVRAVATNALHITDPHPMQGVINLDAGICPLDPEVVAITVAPVPPTVTNPDSGGRQGTLTLTAYTPSRTSTPIGSVRLAAKGPQDAEWVIENSETAEHIEGQELADLLGDLVNTVGPDKPVVSVNTTYQKWEATVDTATLADTITADSPAARDASKDEKQYVVMGYANANGTEVPPIPGVQATFSVDNVDDVEPLGPTNVSVTSVEATDSVFEDAGDGSYTVGGLVDKYDDAVSSPMATLTIEPTAERKTYASVMLQTDAEGIVIGDVTETAEGSGVFMVTIDVGTLADGETYLENGTYMFHALAYDGSPDGPDEQYGNIQEDMSATDGSKISVTVENSYRPAPEIFAITTDPATQTNPDSGAPQGILVHNTYTLGERTSPPITSVRVEVKRQDADDSEWKEVGVTTEGTVISEEEYQELKQNDADFIADFVGVAAETIVSGEATAPIHKPQAYQKWSVSIDTVALELEDTITADSPAARDVAQDSNPYIVRAIALSAANESETAAPSGVQSRFSLDNVDDVAPLGPTNITAVTHVAEGVDAQPPIAANEDGSYTVGGIVDESVPSPMIMLTVEPTAEPKTYAAGSVRLVQTDVDGNQITADSEPGVLEAPTVDIGMLENGTYMFHALVIDEFGNVQADDSETDGSRITVHVLNFRTSDISDLAVIAVDSVDVADAPAEPIPLRNSVAVSFMVANGSLAADHLSGAINGSAVPSESAEDPENTFSLTVMELSALPDGMYTPDGVVTQWNGSVPFSLAMINLDNTGPMITIETPSEDHTVDSLPTVHATYNDGEGSGPDSTGKEVLAWATTELADGPTVGLVRTLPEQGNQDIPVEQAAIETDATTLVYTRNDQLAGGAYKITVSVADVLGNIGEATREFAISGTIPTVAIQSPAGGQTVEDGRPLISGEFSGAGTVEITTFTIDGTDATPEVDGNRFSYTPGSDLSGGSHTVVVEVTDGDGKTAQTSATFTVKTDTTPPVISAAAPSGVITGDSWVTLSAVVTDEQSSVVSVKFGINDKPFRSVPLAQIAAGRVEVADSFTAGTHTVRVVAISEGGTTEHSWTFTLVVDNAAPAITSITPSGTIRGGLPVISASASDESGVDEMVITLWDSNGKEVKGKTADDGESDVEGITRLDFNPEAPLDEGTYTIEVRATDTIGNSATAKGNFSIDFDTAAPVITMASPQNEARLIERRPQISITYADAESGVDVDSIRFVFDDKLINLAPNQKSASQVLYTPPADLAFGQHTVKLEVSDMAHKEGNVSDKNSGARKANMAVHEFTFFVESEEGPVLASRPINAPNPFKDNTRISFTLTRQSTVSIVIYDMTFRPVRVLVDNEVWDAGEYVGKGAIGWDGTTTAGEDLARGVYYCQIIVADGFEPEYAILKLALTR